MTKSPTNTSPEAKTETSGTPKPKSSFDLRQFIFGLIVILVIPVVGWYIYDAFTHAETDDAYISGHVHDISAQVNGLVLDVPVEDNQTVKAGDLLVQIDPKEYQAFQMIASANLAKATADYLRQKPLVAAKALSDQDFAATEQTYKVDMAELALAELQLSYTKVIAPTDGTIGRKNVESGNRISSGQTLMVLVEPHIWVTANFKETQIPDVKVGQPVEIWVDRIPGHTFRGHVDSFSPGSGNQFALLPADNSTGNFTKIVQRVPVKIEFEPESIKGFETLLVPGLSVEAKIALKK